MLDVGEVIITLFDIIYNAEMMFFRRPVNRPMFIADQRHPLPHSLSLLHLVTIRSSLALGTNRSGPGTEPLEPRDAATLAILTS